MKYCVFAVMGMAYLVATTACSKQNEEALRTGTVTQVCDTVNMTYNTDVLPIITANCYSCHGNGEAHGGTSLGDYSSLKNVAASGDLLHVINHDSGFPAMPESAPKLSQCDIDKITDWVNRGAQNN